MSADGKLAPAKRNFEPFSSRRDRLLMMELRACAEAVLAGARTVDLNPVTLGNGGKAYTRLRLARGLAEHPVRVVVSGRASLNPEAEIFRHRFSPIVILASERAPASRLRSLRKLADAVGVFGRDELDWPAALRWLRQEWRLNTLLCEGGGEVNAGLLESGLVNEIYVTVCPLILGGRAAPTLADGHGVARLQDAQQFALAAMKRFGDELFLKYQVHPAKRKKS